MYTFQEASSLLEKAGVEERKLYISNTHKTSAEQEDNGMKENEDNPPPAPILLSRTDHSLTFAPAPYNLEGQVRFASNYLYEPCKKQIMHHSFCTFHYSAYAFLFHYRCAGTSSAAAQLRALTKKSVSETVAC